MKHYVRAGKYDDEIEYYSEGGYGSEYIQLSDNHTLWQIDGLENATSEDYTDFDDLYELLVDQACDKFKEKTGVEIYCLGRSGRHICVEDTPQNRRRYRSLCNAQSKLENWVVNEYNKAVADFNAGSEI